MTYQSEKPDKPTHPAFKQKPERKAQRWKSGESGNPKTPRKPIGENFRARVVFNKEETKRAKWLMHRLELEKPDDAIKACMNFMVETIQHFDKNYSLYFEKKVAGRIYRRRILIS